MTRADWRTVWCGVVVLGLAAGLAPMGVARAADTEEVDLLIVGGGESGCAAAIQAARLGVRRIVLVNDIEWLGGQFSAEGVGCLDEWTTVGGKRVNFPRSGLFQEMVARIRAENSRRYGIASPGNAYCGTETVEPAVAAGLFETWLAEYGETGTGQVRIARPWEPVRVEVEGNRVAGVEFQRPGSETGASERLLVRARLTIDASDWGDVIRLSGASYFAGPDPRSRFGEPSAPERLDEIPDGHQEMNPLTWCVVLREQPDGAAREAVVPQPEGYVPLFFKAVDTVPPWVDSDLSAGIYSATGWSIYTHRRLVDRRHLGLPVGTEATFLNWPTQDYPLCQLPQQVVDALEANEAGASRKNIVEMTPAQRRIVFEDAKRHALGFLYHLQTRVHDRVGDYPASFRYMRLTEEFGTADRLPPKPYVREGLRLEALAMLREQEIRASGKEPRWAKELPLDAAFGFQFNIDFHPTRRKYDGDDRRRPWRFVHTPARNWHTDTDRAMFPLRGLVPVKRDGLLGAGKNIGVTSVVQSALRLHGQMMLVGQATAHVAWMSLRDGIPPREVAGDAGRVRELQTRLVRGTGGPGVLIWPWHDMATDDPAFEAANLLTVWRIWQADAGDVRFHPEQTITRRELARTLFRLLEQIAPQPAQAVVGEAKYTDVPTDDPDRGVIEAVIARGRFGEQLATFTPEGLVDSRSLHRWLAALDLAPHDEFARRGDAPVSRSEFVRTVAAVLRRGGPQAK